MKVNIGIGCHNSKDWDRFIAGAWDKPMETPDHDIVMAAIEMGDMAEKLGFDGIWAPEHNGTPYGMTPNPIQLLTYFAGRTERVNFGTMVAVTPWWHPTRLAHQIAYLDIISNGRFDTIGLGRGVAKSEFDAVGVPRDEARQRFDETIDILKLAFTQERFSYDGEIFKLPEMSIRPQYRTKDLAERFYGASSTGPSLEINARRGLKPLFVGNKSIQAAGEEVKQVNTFRQEMGLPPCQPKNVLFMFCSMDADAPEKAAEYINDANRDVTVHYGFGDPKNFEGVKGYESYAARQAYATAPQQGAGQPAVAEEAQGQKKSPGYDETNLLIGRPETIIERIMAGQKEASFSEVTILPNFGSMPMDEAHKSLRLFAEEVLPVIHKMEAPLQPHVLPDPRAVAAA